MAVLGKTKKGKLNVDIKTLISTRMLIQANSGGGKSYAIRKLLEETHGAVQQIVLDSEGEFSTLREKLDYLICAPKGADVIATPQTATVLARTLLELGTSAIIDIYELKAHERPRFIRLFLDAMMNAPKKLWHPVMTVIDEAHVYCPEKGKAESTGAVIDLATRGRKRGYCAVLATQRLSKLHKDTAAELLNKLIGRTGLDIDVKRAADELGMTPKDAIANLRPIKAGTFYAFGPALSLEVEKVVIGKVKTTHPEAGKMANKKTPPPTAKVKKILANIGDLAKEAEEETRTIAEFKNANAELKRKLTVAGKQGGGTDIKEVERLVTAARNEAERNYKKEIAGLVKENNLAHSIITKVQQDIGRFKGHVANIKKNQPVVPERKDPVARTPIQRERSVSGSSDDITKRQQEIIDAIARLENMKVNSIHKKQAAAFAGVSPNSGAYANNLGALRSGGLIDYPNPGYVALTDEGRSKAAIPDRLDTDDDYQRAWYELLSSSRTKILQVLIEEYPNALPKDDLGIRAGVSSTSGAFANNLGAMRSLGIVDYPRSGIVVATPLLFPESS